MPSSDTSEIELRYAQLREDFEILGSWSLRYQSLVEGGRELPPLDPQYKIQEFYVEGCVSALWVRAECREGRMYYEADSDGVLPKGLVALLVGLFSGALAEEVLAWERDPIKDLGFGGNLTPTRIQAFFKMMIKFKEWAARCVQGDLCV